MLDLADIHFRQTDVLDLALSLQVYQRSQLIFGGHLRIDAVQLIKIYAIEAQAAQAALACGDEMLGSSVLHPAVGAWAVKATLGSDPQVCGIGMQGLGD